MPNILPYSMQDKSNIAIENCINQAFNIDMSKFLTYINDNLSDDVLFAKAKMFHIFGSEGWNGCKTKGEKISLLNNAIRTHRFKGTVYSIRSRLVNIDFEYLAWYQYNGIPNHFKVIMYVDKPVTEETKTKIMQAINEYKRLSSKLDKLEIHLVIKNNLNLNTALMISRKVLVK